MSLKRWLHFAGCLLIFRLSVHSDPTRLTGSTNAPTTPAANATSVTLPPSIHPSVPETPSASDSVKNLESEILDSKTCQAVELAPDESWLAVTRTYTTPSRGHIWDTGEERCCLLIREVDDEDGTGTDLQFGPDFFFWDLPVGVDVVKIAWSRDSRFLLLVCSSAEGHQPWAFTVLIFDTKDNVVHNTDPLGTVVSQDLKFTGDDTVELKTGEPSSPQAVDFEIDSHIAQLPVVSKLERESLVPR